MATINQLVRKPRKRKVTSHQERCSRAAGLPATSRRLHARLHYHPEEAELGFAKGLPRASHQRV